MLGRFDARLFQPAGGKGCGRKIKWFEMRPVPVPDEFKLAVGKVSVDDVPFIPKTMQKTWLDFYTTQQENAQRIFFQEMKTRSYDFIWRINPFQNR